MFYFRKWVIQTLWKGVHNYMNTKSFTYSKIIYTFIVSGRSDVKHVIVWSFTLHGWQQISRSAVRSLIAFRQLIYINIYVLFLHLFIPIIIKYNLVLRKCNLAILKVSSHQRFCCICEWNIFLLKLEPFFYDKYFRFTTFYPEITQVCVILSPDLSLL